LFLKIYIISDFFHTNYLNIHRTDLHKICWIGRTLAVDERSDVIFLSIPRGTLPWQPIFWTKSTSIPHIVVRTTFARAAPPAYDKKGSCYAGHRQTNYLMQWTQANQLTDNNKLTGGEVDMHMKSEVIFLQSICRWATDRLCLASSYSVAGEGLKSSLATISYDQREQKFAIFVASLFEASLLFHCTAFYFQAHRKVRGMRRQRHRVNFHPSLSIYSWYSRAIYRMKSRHRVYGHDTIDIMRSRKWRRFIVLFK